MTTENTTTVIETEKVLWALQNNISKKMILEIETTYMGRSVNLGPIFKNRDDAREVKKLLKTQFPRRSYDVIRFDTKSIDVN